ncbi:alpha/beta fold hydrolase [Flavitalea sp. BT771]|uniref:alpha/beta fold hydrolase n=1 Tax=Flavitalea sp. BT771 TaxID=3063329 RepID=UPI0026E419BA|nr:alpha/beta fold hydrolase [Flavitalea sp. BT771]MDO6433650.1 alpha/beta fold hydrolase [Flavitalea sp. BT771]MDV6222445.1 alpha/beta fold hydrolase [Flavitalea sp. BT771]
MHLLLLHGALGAENQLSPLAAELENEFTVHTMDFSGHGREPFPDSPFSIPMFAQDVLTYMDEMQLPETSIFGYSMGGYVGMYLALHHRSRVTKLATLATKFHWDPTIAQREIQMINPEKILEKLPPFAKILEQRHQPKDWKTVLQKTADLLIDLGDKPLLSADNCNNILVPTLLMLGDRDKMVSLGETADIHKSIPNAQLAILPGTPHPIEQVDTIQLADHLRRFL